MLKFMEAMHRVGTCVDNQDLVHILENGHLVMNLLMLNEMMKLFEMFIKSRKFESMRKQFLNYGFASVRDGDHMVFINPDITCSDSKTWLGYLPTQRERRIYVKTPRQQFSKISPLLKKKKDAQPRSKKKDLNTLQKKKDWLYFQTISSKTAAKQQGGKKR